MNTFFKIFGVIGFFLTNSSYAGLRDDKVELTLYEPADRMYSLPALPLKPQEGEPLLRYAQRSVGNMLILNKWKESTTVPLGPLISSEEALPSDALNVSDSEESRSLALGAERRDRQEESFFSIWTCATVIPGTRERFHQAIFAYVLLGDSLERDKKPKTPKLSSFPEGSKTDVMSRQWIEDVLAPLEESPEKPWKTHLRDGCQLIRMVIVGTLEKGKELVPGQDYRLQLRCYGVKDRSKLFSSRDECGYLKADRFMSRLDTQDSLSLGLIAGVFGVSSEFYPKDRLVWNEHLRRSIEAEFRSSDQTVEILKDMRARQAKRRAQKASQGSGSGSSSSSERDRPAPVRDGTEELQT